MDLESNSNSKASLWEDVCQVRVRISNFHPFFKWSVGHLNTLLHAQTLTGAWTLLNGGPLSVNNELKWVWFWYHVKMDHGPNSIPKASLWGEIYPSPYKETHPSTDVKYLNTYQIVALWLCVTNIFCLVTYDIFILFQKYDEG